MASNLFVTVSGPALSLLMYENVIGNDDQRGFLLGEVTYHVINSISDSDIQNEKTETSICVTSLLPIPNSVSFYSGSGKVNEDRLKDFLKDNQKDVVGWYSFKRYSGLTPLLRDRVMHKAFCGMMSHVSPDLMTMCLLNATTNLLGSTHIFNHKFMRYNNNKFEVLPMRVHNLGETQNTLYRTTPSVVALTDSFKNIVKTNLQEKEGKSDNELVSRIQLHLQNHLRTLIDEVAVSEMDIADLETMIESLRNHSGSIPNEILLPQLLQETATASSETKIKTELNRTQSSTVNQSGDSPDLFDSPKTFNSSDKKDLNNVTVKEEFSERNTPTKVDPFEKSLTPDIKTAMAAQLRLHRVDSQSPSQPNASTRTNASRRILQDSTPKTLPRINYSQALKKTNNVPEDQDESTSKRCTRARASANGSEN